MPKITIQNLNNKVISYEQSYKSILNCLLENQQDWMHACGGKGRCTTCAFNIIDGLEHLSKKNEAESKLYKQGKLTEKQRLACQCTLDSDIVIAVPKKNQLPHLNYNVL